MFLVNIGQDSIQFLESDSQLFEEFEVKMPAVIFLIILTFKYYELLELAACRRICLFNGRN